MLLYGVVNASPDSLNTDSIVGTPREAASRARQLLGEGADAIDLGGQGSTDAATVVGWTDEWARLEPLLPVLAELGVPISVDTWRPEVARRALAAGATVLNAADGMQTDEMWAVAAEAEVDVVLPWKNTDQHDELLEIVLQQRPEYGRVHYPAKVRAFEHRLGLA